VGAILGQIPLAALLLAPLAEKNKPKRRADSS
jgi:hypothetical protein